MGEVPGGAEAGAGGREDIPPERGVCDVMVEDNYFSGTEAGSYSRLIDFCITQL